MRTRNRGQRTSIVSSLGLCPKNRKSRYLRKINQKTHSAVRGKRKVLGSKVKRLTTALNQQTNQKKLRKSNEVQEQTQMTEQLLKKSQKVRSSSRWRLSSEVSSQLSCVSLFKKDSSCVFHNSVENMGSSRSEATTTFRGRKRQYSKVGRPRLVKPSETNQSKTVKKPPFRSSRFRNSQSIGDQDSSTANQKSVELNKSSFHGKNLPDTATISKPRVSQIAQETETAPIVKRPRGRPRSSLITKRKDTDRPELCTKREPKNLSTDRYANEQKCATSARAFDPQVTCSSIYFPKLIKKDDLYCASDLRFGATDGILQQLLQEVSAHGVVPKHNDHIDYSGYRQAEENVSTNTVFMFDVPIVKNVFENIWNISDTVLDLDTKDLFLALNGLLRPGVCELWRRRLEEQSKKLSRSHMGRLRPNPRPRRYSDMFVSSSGQPSVSRHPVPDIPLCTDKARLGSRCVAIAAARLTAAKRLIRARSHKKGSRVVTTETYGFLDTSYQANIDNPNATSRSRRKAQKTSTGNELSSPRTRRRPDVSHHIDWKFCYAQSDKQSSTANTNTPKRRRKVESSPDKSHVSMTIITPESEEICSTEDSTAASYDMDVASVDNHRDSSSLPGVLDTNSDPVKSEPALGEPNTYSFELKKSLSYRLDIERPIDGRRKRRHALTVQRKRPVERPISSFMESEHLLWRSEVPEKSDALSDSSDNSAPMSNYDRPFGSTKWIRPPVPKPKGNLDATSDSRHKSANHSADLLRPRSIVGSAHNKRSLRNSQLQSYMTHRGRTSRRPDRMCRLTLLDRLLLGLNCSVAQNDDEIHVKRLHKDELSILTQRINKTGFSITSVSVRKSANNDAEYNIVLTFSPNADASMRRVQCSPLGTRARMPSSMRSLERGSRESPTLWSGSLKLKGRQFPMHPLELRSSSRKSLVRSNNEHSHRRLDSTYSVSSGYHSDTDVFCRKVQLPKLRRTHSDTDLIELQQSAHEPIFSSAQRNLESLLNQATNVPFPSLSLEVNGERQPSVSSGTFQTSKDWSRCSTLDRVSSTLMDRHYFADGTQKRGVALSRTGAERQSYENEGHSITTATAPHGITKRPIALDSQASNHITPFRRHSPRKVIRKVYTGSSTIPKILNRKRPTGSPSLHLSAPTCSVPSTSSLLTSLSHAMPTNASTSSAVNSLATSSCTPNVSSSSAPAIIFDEPTPSLPICPPTSVAGFSFQYRRFPAPVMPMTVVPTSTKLVDHSINVAATAATSTSVYNDSRLPGVVRFRSVSSIPMGSTVAPVPIKTPERTHLADLSTTSSISTRLLSTGPLSNTTDDPETDVSMTEEKTGTPNLSTDVPKPPINTIPSVDATNDVPRSSKPTEVRSSASVVAAPSSHLTASVASPDGNAELTNCENELPSDWDGSNTPATSMSASQLLKLKRLHDEAGRAVSAPSGMSESRTTQSTLYSSFPGRVQSPQALPLQSKQAQSVHTETVGVAQLEQPSQPEHSSQELPHQQHAQRQQQQQQKQPLSNSQQLQQPQRATLPSHQGDPSFCTVPSVAVGSDAASMDVTEDADEFELKSIDQPTGVICSDPTHTDPSTLVTADIVLPSSTMISSTSSDSVLRPSLANASPRLQRLPWPVVRPPNLSASTTRPSVLASANGSTTGQLTTRVVMQTPSSLGVPIMPSNTPSSTDSSTTDHTHHRLHHAQHQQVTLSCSPLMLPPSMSVGTASAFDPSSQALSVTNYNQPNTGSLKRTIVHKYHSFRKILPKSPEHLGNFVSTATLQTIPTLGTSSPGLTQLPMIGTTGGGPSAAGSGIRMYRNISLSQPNLLSCDPPAEAAYFVDIPANLTDVTCDTSRTVGHSTSFGLQAYASVTTMTNTTTTAAASSLINNPASQLLKSLLESSDAKETTNTVLTIPVQQSVPPSGTKKTLPNVTSSTGVVTWNQPAHQSRGTWQLGKRVHSTSASSRSVTDNVSSVHPRHSANSELRGAPDTGERHSHSTTELASSVKLFPGPKSRLQQLQQHYQRRSQLQQVQSKSQSTQPPIAAPSQQPQALDQIVHEQPT